MLQVLEFPHSHYCEKARWALDLKGVAYRRKALFPGLHLFRLRGLPATSVPVLLDGGVSIQGSREILDYLDRRYPQSPLTPSDDAERAECVAWERYLDREIGEHIRRYCYFHLLGRPDLLGYFFCYGQSPLWRVAFRLAYPALRTKLVDAYDIRAAGTERSRVALHTAMARLGAHLEGREFIVGDRLTRADITAASLLSLFALPPEHPVAWPEMGDAGRQALEPFAGDPLVGWTRELYRTWRRPNAHAT